MIWVLMYDLMVDQKCLTTLITSAVEVYNKETSGLLLGSKAKITLNGRRKDIICLKNAYPLQTADRKPTSVESGNISAHKRAVGSLITLNQGLVGEFHSHPDWHTKLSKSDFASIEEEMAAIKKAHDYPMNKWLELVVSVKKRAYEKAGSEKMVIRPHKRKLSCTIKTEPKIGYDLTLAGYWLQNGTGKLKLTREAKIYLS